MTVQYSRRDFYKISLVRGNYRYHYADKSLDVQDWTLLFHNPQVPYTWEMFSDEMSGYFCIFTESFFTEKIKGSLADLPMFAIGGKPAYALTIDEDAQVAAIFAKMNDELQSDYPFKYDLIRNYVMELVHFALKRQPSEALYKHPDANARITSVFMELLERQFPIERTSQRFGMRSAKDFAAQLAVHVNHLNRAVKTTTGKTNEIADYTGARASQQFHQEQMANNQPGDPVKGAAALITVSQAQNPPVHLFLGSDAHKLAQTKMEHMAQELENWKQTATSTDF